jgi:hypothetical protein
MAIQSIMQIFKFMLILIWLKTYLSAKIYQKDIAMKWLLLIKILYNMNRKKRKKDITHLVKIIRMIF